MGKSRVQPGKNDIIFEARGLRARRILVSRVKLRGSEMGVNIIPLHRRKLTTVSAVRILIFSAGGSTMLFNPIHGADTQSRSARHEVLVYGRLNFKYRVRTREPVSQSQSRVHR